MKKINSIGKLNLAKSTLSLLSSQQLNTILGGDRLTASCNAEEKHMPSSPVICK